MRLMCLHSQTAEPWDLDLDAIDVPDGWLEHMISQYPGTIYFFVVDSTDIWEEWS